MGTQTRAVGIHGRHSAWLLAGSLALVAAAAVAPKWLRQEPAPLVIVVVFDALRADHLSQYGYPLDTSPGLEKLARRATLFEQAYAPSSYTTASTASLLTGQSPLRHGARRQGASLAAESETLAEVLGAHGFRTRGISFNPVVADATGFTQGFEDFVEREAGSPFNLYPDIARGIERIHAWLEDDGVPQLVYFQPMNTHGPYLVPESAASTLLGRPPDDRFRYYGSPMAEILAGEVAKRSEVTPEYVKSAIERYDTAIRYSTDALGAFLETLEAQGKLDEALVVVTADHGDEFFEHGGFSHGYTLYDEVIRVPLIVKLPGQREARRVPDRVTLMDVMPTIAEAVGAPAPVGLDGRSLLAFTRGEAPPPAPTIPLVVDFSPRLVARGRIEGDHKLIAIDESYDGLSHALRLFDLGEDPHERTDIATQDPVLTRILHAKLLREGGDSLPAAAAPVADLDRELLEQLGYAQGD
jgi:arylsulfatase